MDKLIDINIDFKGLDKLADTVLKAVGLTAYGAKKMADANSYIVIKDAEAKNQVDLIRLQGEEKVSQYVLARETRKVNNVCSVIEKAQEYFTEDEKVSNEPVNEDWANRFFSTIEDVSDDDMQKLWAQILAGEIKQPKSFSLRTLDLLKNLTKDEAKLFILASELYITGNVICTEEFAMPSSNIWLLCEIGLINSDELNKIWKIEPHNKLEIHLNNSAVLILHNSSDKQVDCNTSVRLLTKAGIELLTLIDKPSYTCFINKLVTHFKSKGATNVFIHDIVECNPCSYKTIGQEL